MPLADIAGYGAYTERKRQNEQASLAELQQATGAMGLLATMQKQKDDAALKTALAESGGDVDKALQIAVQSGNMGAAHQLAPLVEIQRKKAEATALAGVDMTDPRSLRDFAAKSKKPEFVTHAERIEKQREDAEALKQMQTGPAQVIQPDPQENALAADQGTPMVAQVTKEGRPGIFSDLMQSQIPHIAAAAKNQQAQLDRSGSALPASFWQKQRESLQARESQYMQQNQASADRRANAPEPLVAVKEADGRVTYVPRSQAAGREVGVRTTDPNLSKSVQQLGRDFEKAELNTTIPVIENAQKITLEQAKWLTGPYAKAPDATLKQMGAPEGVISARQDLAKFFNITLKNRSGAAVTEQELRRLEEEFGKGLFRTPESLLQAIQKGRAAAEKHYQGIAASHGKAALDAYNENVSAIGGTPFNHRSTSPATPAPSAAPANNEDLRKKYNLPPRAESSVGPVAMTDSMGDEDYLPRPRGAPKGTLPGGSRWG